MNRYASRFAMLLGMAVLTGFLILLGLRVVRPEGIAGFVPSLIAAAALGTFAARTAPSSVVIGAACGGLVYLTVIVANAVLFWRDGRLVGDGPEWALVFVALHAVIGGVAAVVGRAGGLMPSTPSTRPNHR